MTKEIRDDLKCTDTHEWIKIKDDIVRIGITDYAQSELTDIVFAELPEIGKEIKKGDELCVVESVKSVSEIISPISGVIISINNKLEDNPEIINENPYDDGWLVEMKFNNKNELKDLIDSKEYNTIVN
jgi:glycine cleavage system H protein